MRTKEDRRVKFTKLVLREALLDLLKEKSINQISVAELCRLADVNRNTFYSHYNGPYEILNVIENEMFEELAIAIENLENVENIILVACRTLERNAKASKLIFSEGSMRNILLKALQLVKEKQYNTVTYNRMSKTDLELAEKVYLFNESGTIALINDWIKNDFREPVESVAKTITLFVNNINILFAGKI
ncbi:hypothetical protein DBR39_01410 [Chryseobacterium sp. KBW03]|jgi:AcrR family transcriptional regulator|uniref:TetR-like C-terminal domain-containing protein n=1 Tax=Chryseobacterium sp. KBW03 TaxID=2153362 RepID=UPI000F5A0A97|nr:TetR-like C-terminal domain-containing protein [Chryseobacterium sp. KBW03]RQO42563.1 hypothetical protein DBR39_01410 [Chryseobacterium sp. KBW03]